MTKAHRIAWSIWLARLVSMKWSHHFSVLLLYKSSRTHWQCKLPHLLTMYPKDLHKVKMIQQNE